MNLNKFTKQQYQKFSRAEGSQYIASEYALFRILRLIKKYKPKIILEAGVGIGTISHSILKAKLDYIPIVYGTESNTFCLEQLPLNFKNSFESFYLYPDIQSLPSNLIFDFIIIDGKEKYLSDLQGMISKRSIVVVEGDRKDQVEIVKNLFPKSKFVHSITSVKNSSYSNRSKDHFKGGLKIIFINPDLKQKMECFRLKLLSKIHFQLRKLS